MIVAHPFWSEPAGCGAVVRGRYSLFSLLFDTVSVLYLDQGSSDIRCPFPGAAIQIRGALTAEHVSEIQRYLGQQQITHLYFSYDLARVAQQLQGYKILELHDVMHLREQAFSEYGYAAPISVKPTDELASMKRYDCVFVLNSEELRYLAAQSVDQAIYLPPSVTSSRTLISPEARSVGLIGSNAKPNLHGLRNCLGLLSELGGVIAGQLSKEKELVGLAPESLLNMGIVDDVAEFYSRVEVVLSPIKFGAGLKIKVLEAIAYGRPVLATEHSVAGFPEEIRDFVIVNDDVATWDKKLVEQAKALADRDFEGFCRKHFSAEVLIDRLRHVFGINQSSE